jgi:hypothetical protein
MLKNKKQSECGRERKRETTKGVRQGTSGRSVVGREKVCRRLGNLWQRAKEEWRKWWRKKLEVNVEKTKMMVFNKIKSEENEWNWEGTKIEHERSGDGRNKKR